jgi:hypothetical protein
MRVTVLGTGDLTKIPRFTDISKEQLEELIQKIAKLLAEKGHEVVIIPDRGVPLEIAKLYKEQKGKKVLGVVPTKDKKYGTRHIEPNFPILDEKIEVDSWYDADGEIAAQGDVCIVIGISPGIMREIAVLKYHYRYLKSKTKLVWFKNTISSPIAKEIEEEIPINYITSVEELGKILSEGEK